MEKSFITLGTGPYKRKSSINYTGFSYAENLVGYFSLKIFSIAKSSVIYAGFSFIGLVYRIALLLG